MNIQTTILASEARKAMSTKNHRPVWAARYAAATLAAALLTACDVTNPGPVQDEFLNQPEAHQALVNGAGRRLAIAISSIGYAGALSAREIMPAGQTGSGGHSPVGQAGTLISSEVGGEWNNAQQARWIAEDAIRRFTTVVPAGKTDPAVFAQAYLFAGYANRTLGENMCDAVFDGGSKESTYKKYFERAITDFDKAIATAPNTTVGNTYKNAAYAGRAAAKVWMNDWTGAVADAKLVPVGFTYNIPVSLDDAKQDGQDLYWANQNTPYRGYTLWKTWYETYYDQTGDARAAYNTSAAYPLAQQQLSGYGAVPWKFSRKYEAGFDHHLASYKEMLLIQAEAALRNNDIAGAMALINQVHTSTKNLKGSGNLAPLATPANITDAWTLLKRERSLELYLEARRLGDLRRWKENNTPGAIDWPDFESVSKLFKDNPPSSCFPIPDSELLTNTNLG
jgi:hypothetical protein